MHGYRHVLNAVMDGVAGASDDTEDLLKHYGKVGMDREQVVTEGRKALMFFEVMSRIEISYNLSWNLNFQY